MPLIRHSATFLVLLYLAAVGFALVYLPPMVIDKYGEVARENPNVARVYLGVVIAGAVILLAISVWILARLVANTRQRRVIRERRAKDPSQLSRTERETEFGVNLAKGGQYTEAEGVTDELRQAIKKRITDLQSKRESQTLRIVAFGTISSGKSSLLNTLAGRDVFRAEVTGGTTRNESEIPWPGRDRVILADTPGLAEVRGEYRGAMSAAAAKDADLVLFVVDGPLKDYEQDLIERLASMEKRVLICLNKTDWFGDAERDALLAQIREQVGQHVEAKDIVAVRSRGGTRRRVRVLADGSEADEVVTLEPDIEPLADRMLAIIQRDGRDLLLANLLMQSRGLVDDAKERVLAALDERAEGIIKKYMWAAGSATAVNPIPLLDIAGGSAITIKMVVDLAQVYRQNVDTDTVVNLLAQLGKNLIAMIGAAAATPALIAGVGTVIKTVPGVGTIAGGLLQGSVQALVTRWIGRVFCEYFRNEMQPPPGGLAELARRKWTEVTRAEEIRKLVTSGRLRLADEKREAHTAAARETARSD
jgi:small GTP-binding protein